MTAFIGRREFITLLGGAAAWPLAAGRAEVSICKMGSFGAIGRHFIVNSARHFLRCRYSHVVGARAASAAGG
jgi:hypothetical protein